MKMSHGKTGKKNPTGKGPSSKPQGLPAGTDELMRKAGTTRSGKRFTRHKP